ncbi:MAG: ATP-binding cassette domain-containing protein [Desulfobacterales bacterium]|nr:ATP-binding cassette domain-containing protein [Desulfobacterales bacterium]
MIEVENVTKVYGQHRAIDGITFSMEEGEVLGFLGPNGAGKTTLMRILTCFFPATQGRAVVAGFDCFADSLEVRRRIGYLPERVQLYEDMKVRDYLSFVAGIKGVPRRDIRGRVARTMGDCGVDGVSNRVIGNLSRGYRQRVGLAQALINDPEVLILDEPTVGLDPKQIKEIRKLIKDLAGKRTVILSTHILPEVSMVCGRVIIINKGKLVAIDTPENLTSRIQSSSKMLLRISGASPVEIEQQLGKVSGVKSVTIDESILKGPCGFIVEVGEERDVRRNLHPAIVNEGWELAEMRSLEMSLEDVFIKLVTREERL